MSILFIWRSRIQSWKILPEDKISDVNQTDIYRHIGFVQIERFMFEAAAKIVGEKEKMLLPSIFSYFPTMLSKALSFMAIKTMDCLV